VQAKDNIERQGRDSTQLRPINFQLGIVKNASGSSYVDLGRTKVVVSVYGPRKQERNELTKSGSLYINLRFAPFARKKRKETRHFADAEETSLANSLEQAFSNLVLIDSKFAVDAHVVILEDDGGAFSCAVSCLSAALVHAKIGIRDICIGSSVAFIGNNVCVDPTKEELSKSLCSLECVYSPSKDKVLFMDMKGSVSMDQMKLLFAYALQSGRFIQNSLRKTLIAYQKSLQGSEQAI